MKRNNTNFILVVSTIMFIAISFSFLYFLNIIKNKNKHISAVAIAFDQKIKEKNNINTLEKKMAELEETQRKIGGYIVNTSSIDIFVEYLESIGPDNDIELVVKSVDAPKNESNKVVINMSLLGSFSDILRTIGILENSQYNISISNFYVNKNIKQVTQEVDPKDAKNIIPVVKEPSWQANITFSVLSI